MSCNKFFKTTGVVVPSGATEVLPENIHRKGLVIFGLVGQTLEVAFGTAPAADDYFPFVGPGPIFFDTLVPVGALWAKGAGTIIYGEST